MPYLLPTKVIDPALVGDSYHFAIGTTTPGQSSPDRIFGYLLKDGTSFKQATDLKSRDQLLSVSPNLIDRDLVTYPRITDGDFSGGGLQINWIDPSRYWDSDLEVRIPGYLALRPGWDRLQASASVPLTAAPIGIAFGGNAFFSFKEASGNIYTLGLGVVNTVAPGPAIPVICMTTEGSLIYVTDGVNTIKSAYPGNAWATLTAAAGPIKEMWAVNLGTAGRFLYYTPDWVNLWKQDLNAAWGPVQVPLALTQFSIIDLVAYGAGVAIVTNDNTGGAGAANGVLGTDVWLHDGASLSHMIRVNDYQASGICECLGGLYVTMRSAGYEPPALLRINNGAYDVVVRATPVSPLKQVYGYFGAPIASGQTVLFPLEVPQQVGISTQDYIGVYDVVSGSYSHIGNLDGLDAFPHFPGIRQIVARGRAAAFPMWVGSAGNIQYQQSYIQWSSQNKAASSGWLCSSRIDFNTPGIAKLIRRVTVHHAPLAAGESLQIRVFVDSDPTAFVWFLVPIPAGATATNSTVGSTTTVLTLPSRTIGHSLYFALKLTAGTGQLSTPNVYYVTTEVTVPWTFQFTADCSTERRLLNGQEDTQGLRGKDLYFLLHNAWEDAQPVTFYHPNGNAYTCQIESLEWDADNPVSLITPEHPADLEGTLQVTLRDSLV